MAGEGLRSASELTQRVVSAVIMAALAVAVAWFGGLPFAVVWIGLAVAVAYEWGRVVAAAHARLLAVAVGAVGAVFLLGGMRMGATPMVLAALAGAIILVLVIPREGPRGWLAGGVLYGVVLAFATIAMRGEGTLGFVAILYMFAVVWMTDIGAYFAGRTFGGPKFAPRISPKKTWSGVVGGLFSGVLFSLLVLWAFGHRVTAMNGVVSLILGISVVYGDLFESFLKRRFGVKDAGAIIPGHGGFLDRLDGFTVAIALAALLGALRSGFGIVAEGLLTW